MVINIFLSQKSFSKNDDITDDVNAFSVATVTPKVKKHPHVKNKYIVHQNYGEKNVGKNKKISYEKFKTILINESFPESSIDRMWCIAKNESSFNPLAYNYNRNGSFDVGLFQINQTWKQWCRMRDKDLLEVKNNAHCALLVLKKQGYFAWTTFKKFCS